MMNLGENIKMVKIISLGWGVQSWTLAAMTALGELPPVDAVVHADTSWERAATYQFAAKWTAWLESNGVRVVTLSPPPRANRITNNHEFVQIPAFTNGTGQLKRQCTNHWKIKPIRRFVSAELKRRGMTKTPGAVEMWLGITTDEWWRMKHSNVQYIKNVYPLLDKRMSRNDCISWLLSHDLPVPPKSSCTFCPYHSPEAWAEMKRDGGADWQQAVEIDNIIRDKRPPDKIYLLRDCIPLEELKIPEDYGYLQSSIFDDNVTCDSGYCFM